MVTQNFPAISKRINDTRDCLNLRLASTGHALTMTSNAGIKRIRRPRGLAVVRTEIRVAPETGAAMDAARRASGDLSLSLYIEGLVKMLKTERGALPVLPPNYVYTEVLTPAAA